MGKLELACPAQRIVAFFRNGLAVVEAAEVLILRLLLFCTLVYHFIHGVFNGK